jgi:hypothetical protein
MDGLFSGVVGIIALVALFLAALLPFFVVAISSRIWRLLQETKQQTEMLKKIKVELEKSNALSRQLLRSYGHDPLV